MTHFLPPPTCGCRPRSALKPDRPWMNLSLHGDRHCVERNGGVVFRRLALLAKLFYITILGTACEPVPLAVEESAKSPPRLEARVESATDSSRYIVVLREESRQRVGVLDEMTRDIEN